MMYATRKVKHTNGDDTMDDRTEDRQIKIGDKVKFSYPVDDVDAALVFLVLEIVDREFPLENKIRVCVDRPWDGLSRVSTFLYAESSLVKI